MGIGVKVRVWGKYALFSRPDIGEYPKVCVNLQTDVR